MKCLTVKALATNEKRHVGSEPQTRWEAVLGLCLVWVAFGVPLPLGRGLSGFTCFLRVSQAPLLHAWRAADTQHVRPPPPSTPRVRALHWVDPAPSEMANLGL